MSITMIGLETATSAFQIHAINESGKAVLKRKLQRSEIRPFFEKQPPCTVDPGGVRRRRTSGQRRRRGGSHSPWSVEETRR